MSHRHPIDVETTSCVSWVSTVFLQNVFMKFRTVFTLLNDLKRSLDDSLKKQCFRRNADKSNQNTIQKTLSFTLSKKHNYGGTIQPCIVYWGTTNLTDEYSPTKIVIKAFIFVELGTVLLLSQKHRTMPNTKFPLFQIPHSWR